MTEIIAISGYPGSGKSSLRLALSERLSCDYIDYDDYQHVTQSAVDEIAGLMQDGSNYDALVIPQLVSHLALLKHGEKINGNNGERTIIPGDVIIFETPLGREHTATGAFIDTQIWVDVPLDIALARNLRVFLADPGVGRQQPRRDWIINYLENYLAYVRDMLILQRQRVSNSADLVVDGSRPLEDVVSEIMNYLSTGCN